MGKAIGIDYGIKRIGIAITDELKIIASPLTTVPTSDLDQFIGDLILKQDIDYVVIGYPINLDLTDTDSTSHVKGFVKRFERKYPTIPLYLIDERFTSKIAQRTILASGVKKNKRSNKALIDKVSAAIILQSYLDSQN